MVKIEIDNILEVWIQDHDEMLKGKFFTILCTIQGSFHDLSSVLWKNRYHEPRNLPEKRVHKWMEKPLPGPALSPLEPITPDLDPGR
jgi:hypothetical protein